MIPVRIHHFMVHVHHVQAWASLQVLMTLIILCVRRIRPGRAASGRCHSSVLIRWIPVRFMTFMVMVYSAISLLLLLVEVSTNGGSPKWIQMLCLRGKNPNRKWMTTRSTPMTMETPIYHIPVGFRCVVFCSFAVCDAMIQQILQGLSGQAF